MVNYHNVARTVEPKRKKVAEAEKNLRIASKDLAKTQEEVAALTALLADLNKQFAEKSAEQTDLKVKAEIMERRLTAASKLIDGLSSERTRWTKDMQARPHKFPLQNKAPSQNWRGFTLQNEMGMNRAGEQCYKLC